MCGRFASQIPADLIHRLFSTAGSVPNLAANWNVAPTQDAMVIRRHPETGERRLDLLKWGLVPGWTKDLKVARKLYEWKTLPDGKQPYAIARQDGAPVTFAGIWEGWRAPMTRSCVPSPF